MLESLFDKNAGLETCSFIKQRLQHRCFPLEFAKFLITHNLKNICQRLLLKWVKTSLHVTVLTSYVVICAICKEEHIAETWEVKTTLRYRIRSYRQGIRQPQYQSLKLEEQLIVRGNSNFFISPLLQRLLKKYTFNAMLWNEIPKNFKIELNRFHRKSDARKDHYSQLPFYNLRFFHCIAIIYSLHSFSKLNEVTYISV